MRLYRHLITPCATYKAHGKKERSYIVVANATCYNCVLSDVIRLPWMIKQAKDWKRLRFGKISKRYNTMEYMQCSFTL